MTNRKRLALIVCGLLADGKMVALAQSDPYAATWRKGWDVQVADMMNSATVVGKAIGCGIVSPGGNARQSIIARAQELWNQGVVHGSVRPRQLSNGNQGDLDLSILSDMDQKMRAGEASVKRPNGCDFWKDHPEMVYSLRQLDGQ
jgi:hypothetical protein